MLRRLAHAMPTRPLRAHAVVYLSRVAGYGYAGSLLFCGFESYDSAGSVIALSASCVHTPWRVLVVLLNMAVSALSLLHV